MFLNHFICYVNFNSPRTCGRTKIVYWTCLPWWNKVVIIIIIITNKHWFKGCGMGPWLVLVSACFRENVVATSKIGSFLCSLDNLLQKNLTVLFFGNQISKWRSFDKRAIFDLLFTFFSHQGKVTKIPSAYISLTCIYIFCSAYWPFFCLTNFEKKYKFIRVSLWLSPGVDSYSCHFGTINK